jgi:hypothetical protein
MIDDKPSGVKNVIIEKEKNVLNHQLGHVPRGRTNLRLTDVLAFVEKRFDECKEGTKFENLEKKYSLGKIRAQKILKRGVQKGFLFTSRRTNPQKYYPESRHYSVVEYLNNRENVPNHTTGTHHSKAPLSNQIEFQKANSFLEVLVGLRWAPLFIHKIQAETKLDEDSYSIIEVAPSKRNLGRGLPDMIDDRQVQFTYYKNRKVSVYVACSNKPSKLETLEDVTILYSFFGQVRDRLELFSSDPHGRIVPNITEWILKQCDFNKDVPITDKEQVTLPDIQLKTAFETFRIYVKNIAGQACARVEASVKLNELLTPYLESNINPAGEILSRLNSLIKCVEDIQKALNMIGESKLGKVGNCSKRS